MESAGTARIQSSPSVSQDFSLKKNVTENQVRLFPPPDDLTDNLGLREEVLFVRHRDAVKQEAVLEVSRILLDDIGHVPDLLLQLLDLVFELLGLLNCRVDLLTAETLNCVLKLPTNKRFK